MDSLTTHSKQHATDDHSTRLTRAEMTLEQHTATIESISEGVAVLVKAEVRREKDGETFTRIDTAISKLNTDVQDMKTAMLEKELAAYRGIVWKILGVVATIAGAIIAGHYGGKLL